jgi:hypothetical protein
MLVSVGGVLWLISAIISARRTEPSEASWIDRRLLHERHRDGVRCPTGHPHPDLLS